jgi:alpha-tubulin suppressor-like RCC1 family protein
VLCSQGGSLPDVPYAMPVSYLADVTGVASGYVLQRAPPQIVAGNSVVFVPEGGTSSIRIRLGAAPAASVTVNATVTGDSNVTVQAGTRLTFTPSNWDQWQTITLAAAEDADTVDGQAEISMVAEGYTTGIKLQAYEVDNDSTSGSAVWVWGGNDRGQLGDDTTIARLSPVRSISGTAVACGLGHSVVLGSDRNVWTCGRNDVGQLGIGSLIDSKLPVQAQISNVIAIAAADVETVAVKADGTVWRWGAPWIPGQPPGTFFKSVAPTQVPGLTTAIAVAAGREHVVALANGNVWTWGYNKYGELGNGGGPYNGAFPNPVMVSGLSGVTAIAAREYFTVALTSAGRVWAWGENGCGQLGDGTLVGHNAPVMVAGLSNVVAIAAGGSVSGAAGGGHTLALKADGSVWAWGLNCDGQLGDGTSISRTTPVRVSGLTNATGIAAGGSHSVARTSDGRVWTWGYNGSGQLGDGTTTGRLSPAPVLGLAGVVAIAAVDTHTMAVGATGGARPVAVDDVYSTPANTLLSVAVAGVLANDTGTGLTAVKVSDPEHGLLLLNADGSFAYMPFNNYSGEDNFAYKPFVGAIEGNVAAVRVTVVAPNNHPPTITTAAAATPNPVTLPAGTTVSVAASDPDSDPLTYSWTQVTGPGAATFAAPSAASSGVTFSGAGEYLLQVTVTDGRGGSVSSSVLVRADLNFDIRADVNHDGAVNALDSQIIIKNFGKTTP